MVSRFIYPFVFLLVCGNGLLFGSNHAPASRLSCANIQVEPDILVLTGHSDDFDLMEDLISTLVEECSADSREDERDNGKDFGHSTVLCQHMPAPFAPLFRHAPSALYHPPITGTATPIYLLNRVFRI